MAEVKRKSIEQARAKYAWKCAEEGGAPKEGEKPKPAFEKYKSHAREFPMLVLTSGLINAVAFAREKGGVGKANEGDKAWEKVYKHTENWLKGECGTNYFGENSIMKGLLDTNDHQKMRLLTNETISLFTWIKRFVS
jgi:CRISPR type III-B/RAMP module-associated protein Cmr5